MENLHFNIPNQINPAISKAVSEIKIKAIQRGEITSPQKIELERLRTADLSNLASRVNETVNSEVENSSETYNHRPMPISEEVAPCTDCNGSNPCQECYEPTETANNTKSWIDINIPNQGDPTVAQNLALQAANRKKLMIYAGIALASIVVLLFVLKTFKKK